MADELEDVNQKHVNEYIPAIIVVIIILIIGIVGNTFAAIYYGWKAQKCVAQFLILWLSVNDVITNVVLVDDVVDFFHTVKYRSVFACKLFWVLKHFLIGNSLFFMVGISIERYRHVCFPFAKQCTLRAAQFMVAGLAILSLLLSSRYFATADVIRNNLTGQINSTQGYYCSLSNDSDLQSVEDIFHYIDICVHVVIIISLIVFYSQIVRKIIQSKKNIRSHDHLNSISYQKRPVKRENTTDSSTDIIEIHFKNRKCDDSSINSETTSVTDKTNVDNVPLRSTVENEDVSTSSPGSTLKRNKVSKAFGRLTLKSSLSISVKTEIRITVMVAIITLVSMASFIPYYISILAVSNNMTGKGLILSVGEVIWRRSFMLNSAINPFVMAIFNASFRRFISMSVRCKRFTDK